MIGFGLWLLLRENSEVSDYNGLFHAEVQKLLSKLTDPWRKQDAEAMLTFDFSRYILSSLRNAGFRDQNSLTERLHEITVKLLVSPGQLFAGYDETRHGPLSARFKVSMSRLIKNMQAKEANRRRHFSAMPIDMMPAVAQPGHSDDLIDGFRELIQQRLGAPAIQVFDTRLAKRPIKKGSSQKCVPDSTKGVTLVWTITYMRESPFIASTSPLKGIFLGSLERLVFKEEIALKGMACFDLALITPNAIYQS
jgi:hypothetical protein